VSARTRVYAIVAAACVAVGGAAAGIVLAAGGGASHPSSAEKGNPPLELDLGLRTDPEAANVRAAQRLYLHGKLTEAEAAFRGSHALEAQIGSAMASWPDGTVDRLESLAVSHPRNASVLLNLGFALFWEGKRNLATAAWLRAARAQPDTPSAVRAGDLLHPRYNRGLPTFVPSFKPEPVPQTSAARQLALLARRARTGGVRAKLEYGIALQRLGRPVSAERAFAQAAALAPHDVDARVAAAVGRFDKDHPERAFSRLGPLVRVFPHAPSVRFHLGLLLLWLGQVNPGIHQLRRAHAEGPHSLLGHEAEIFLKRLKPIAKR
jgi:tetratricopeptide (TPR) repeat protein